MTDRQLPLEPTARINPRTQVELMPGTDAVCPAAPVRPCAWPFCACFANDKEDNDGT